MPATPGPYAQYHSPDSPEAPAGQNASAPSACRLPLRSGMLRRGVLGVAGFAVALVLAGCSAPAAEGGAPAGDTPAADGTPAAATVADCEAREHAMGVRWQQRSAEVRALQEQTYRFAAERLDELVAEADGEDPLAVVTDLDETVIDNSDLLARDIAACHDFSVWDTWGHWEREGEPRLIPGAREFLQHADELGVDVFYISDRTQENHADTVELLEGLELPQVSDERVLLLGPPKEERRASVDAGHKIVMQLGDTLHDFDAAYADATLESQRQLVEEHGDRFGDDWIVLPNAMYGSWEDAELSEWDAPLEIEE